MPLRLSFRATYFSDSICVISRSPFPVRTFSIPQVIPAHGCEVLRTSGYWDATAPDSQPAGGSGSKRGTRCETSGGPFAHTAEPHHDAPRVGLEHVTRGNARVPANDSAPGAAARQVILSAVGALRVGFRAVAVICQRVPVLYPLPDVPQR